MFIKKVKGNVKAGADVEIGEKTLVVGPNGSGKSTIVNVVELALTSRAGDIAGRVDIAREADVMSLAQAGARALHASVEFDTGDVAGYTTEGSTAKAKKAVVDRPKSVSHEDVLPIRTLREALLGSPQTARKFLMSKVDGQSSISDVEALIPAPLLGHFKQCMPANVPIGDGLVAAIEYAGKQARDAASEAKTAREAAKLVSGGRGAPPSDADVKAASAALSAARSALSAAEAVAGIEIDLMNVRNEIELAENRADEIASQLHNAKAQLNVLKPPKSLPEVIHHVLPVMDESCVAGECLCCGGRAPAKTAADEIRAAIADFQKASAEHTSLSATVAKLSAEAVVRLKALDDLTAKEADLSKKKSSGPGNIEALEQRVALAEQKLVDIKSARDAWASVQKAESTALDADRRAVEWKALKEACENAMALTLDKALGTFIAQVQSNLPKTDTFDLRLRDGDREVVAFGLVRNGVLHTALSGAEWARVTAAMAGACVPPGKYACLIPEERAFDPSTLKDVLTALGSSPHQVIITSPVKPKSVPKGWTVIDRGE